MRPIIRAAEDRRRRSQAGCDTTNSYNRRTVAAEFRVLFTGYVGDHTASTVSFVRGGNVRLIVDPGMVPSPAAILDPLAELVDSPDEITDVIFSHHHRTTRSTRRSFPERAFMTSGQATGATPGNGVWRRDMRSPHRSVYGKHRCTRRKTSRRACRPDREWWRSPTSGGRRVDRKRTHMRPTLQRSTGPVQAFCRNTTIEAASRPPSLQGITSTLALPGPDNPQPLLARGR